MTILARMRARLHRLLIEYAPTYVVDVSRNQRPEDIDWHALYRDGIRAAYIRTSAGSLTVDDAAGAHADGAREAGMLIGYYHAASPDEHRDDAKREALAFRRRTRELPRADLMPMLDLEVGKDELSDESIRSWAISFGARIQSRLGIYGPKRYLDSVDLSPFDAVWLAHWTVGGPKRPLYGPGYVHQAPRPNMPLRELALWQWTSSGAVSGYSGRVDLSLAPRGLRRLLL